MTRLGSTVVAPLKEELALTDPRDEERDLENELLHPTEKWYYNLLNGSVTQEPGPDRLGPYETEDEAAHALELARKRNEEWEEGEDEWNSKK